MRWEYRAVALWPRLGEGADGMNDTGDVTGLLNALGAGRVGVGRRRVAGRREGSQRQDAHSVHEAPRGVRGQADDGTAYTGRAVPERKTEDAGAP